jgi:Pyruvate/2-oxoacid:ferredoxin oxidoreductase delta subunit
MKKLRKIIRIDEEKCDGCGLCVPSCAEGAIQIVDGKARLVAEKFCDGLGACLGECPVGALEVIDAVADDFDEAAVQAHLGGGHGEAATGPGGAMPCGCPSTLIQTFAPRTPCEKANVPVRREGSDASALTNWPVQIHLVPPTAPFLKGADLLVAADCTPVAYPHFHSDLLAGKTVLLGCPKLDDAQAYVDKFAAIFATAGIRSITAAVMEVPCCQGLPAIIRKALAQSGKQIPFSVVTISTRGERLN